MKALEIGCGEEQTPGWDHLDVRPLPGVNFVQSAADLGNIGSGTYDRVVARDVVEHLSWRDVPAALAEWLRVLRPGGVLEVETPNAWELVEQISAPGTSTLPRHGAESDWERFARTAFGHQDYPQNWHGCYFTPTWLTGLLAQAGAGSVETVSCSLQRFRLAAVKP